MAELTEIDMMNIIPSVGVPPARVGVHDPVLARLQFWRWVGKSDHEIREKIHRGTFWSDFDE